MHIYPARTADISLTTGLGPMSVSGIAPAQNMRTFNAVLALGDTVYLGVAHRERNEWEEGIYTYVGTDRFARTIILQSSASGGPVNFSAGIKDVFATVPSRTVQRVDENVTHTGIAEIDFGVSPGTTETSLAISAPLIAVDSFLSAQIVAIATVDNTVADHWGDAPIIVAGDIVVDTGFTIFAKSRSGALIGKYSVAWQWK